MPVGAAVLQVVPYPNQAVCGNPTSEFVLPVADEAQNVRAVRFVANDLTDRPAVIFNKLRPFVHSRDRRLVHVDLGSRFLCPQRGA